MEKVLYIAIQVLALLDFLEPEKNIPKMMSSLKSSLGSVNPSLKKTNEELKVGSLQDLTTQIDTVIVEGTDEEGATLSNTAKVTLVATILRVVADLGNILIKTDPDIVELDEEKDKTVYASLRRVLNIALTAKDMSKTKQKE